MSASRAAAGYAAQGWRQVLADLRDPVLGVFVPAAAPSPARLS